ncbi:DUF3052 domain-containing protein [Shewanella sp. D64]|uniref:hypothetical protein n=1 Tax=unclassified Shewanella TaxID=196818 RepID=UPI0022BA3AFE|nr:MULTISPECIES: hypothetical protein [unclassified Shewanella]MEC4725321.1 DUF3052 domain-containing protein [Shewanella sp. D64]MEC4735833.1 DUF3052 domain-containing protein [Shewanella sp. E94]WBJ93196.1 DUF3052 domain-containing protein [Shewanella sp. MTB7]
MMKSSMTLTTAGKSLYLKLGIKEGDSVYLYNAPDHYQQILGMLPPGVMFLPEACWGEDLVHIFITSAAELTEQLTLHLALIKQDGTIWVSWPKKSARIPSEVNDHLVRSIALPMGLVDNKICAIDDVWTAIKLVIRLENRK